MIYAAVYFSMIAFISFIYVVVLENKYVSISSLLLLFLLTPLPFAMSVCCVADIIMTFLFSRRFVNFMTKPVITWGKYEKNRED